MGACSLYRPTRGVGSPLLLKGEGGGGQKIVRTNDSSSESSNFVATLTDVAQAHGEIIRSVAGRLIDRERIVEKFNCPDVAPRDPPETRKRTELNFAE